MHVYTLAKKMRLVTWNVNGIRATSTTSATTASNTTTTTTASTTSATTTTKSLQSLLDSLEADIICLQETKITRSLIQDDIAHVPGYLAFFSCSRRKEGYSGVVTYCRKSVCPVAAQEGLTQLWRKSSGDTCIKGGDDCGFSSDVLRSLDEEGRCVITEHKMSQGGCFCVVNVYCPHADPEVSPERYVYKMNFYRLLEARCKGLIAQGKHVVLVGDMNVSLKPIDHCDPGDDFDVNPARKWWNGFMESAIADNMLFSVGMESPIVANVFPSVGMEQDNFIDVFRHFHPDKTEAFTCWNTKTRARETNFGTRIDYIITNTSFLPYTTNCVIRADVLGSDHCPVSCDFSVEVSPSPTVPHLCAVFMPELSGKQVGITSYFTKKTQQQQQQPAVKRSHEFGDDRGAKCRKVSENKTMLSYFSSSNDGKKKKPEKSMESEKRQVSLSCLESEELWQSANYTTAEKVSPTAKPSEKVSQQTTWKNILRGPDPSPLCSGHKETSVMRTVKKNGPNLGRKFYTCARPAGSTNNKDARCDFFQWKV